MSSQTTCKKEVYESTFYGSFHPQPCSRKVWSERPNDGYCKQHHPEIAKARQAESNRRYEAKLKEKKKARVQPIIDALEVVRVRAAGRGFLVTRETEVVSLFDLGKIIDQIIKEIE
jgi:hypothetical protein